MKKETINKLLEKSVAVTMLLSLFITVLCMLIDVFIPEKSIFSDMIYYSSVYFVFTILIGLLLLFWIFIGEGVSSKLWNWLPPFLFFKRWGKMGRIFVVLSLFFVIFFGAINELLKTK